LQETDEDTILSVMEQSNVKWHELENGTLIITEYTGNSKEVTIPAAIGSASITEIGEKAFKGNNLTAVIIPDSVTKIGEEALIKS
jgi:hypothetical protein